MKNPVIVLMIALLGVPFAVAGEDPIQQREELMEETRDALKPLGAMAKGERDFDAEVVNASFAVWKRAGAQFGELFPEGSESGGGTEAKSTIWTDREGFDRALAEFNEAVDKAMAAQPGSVDELKPVLGGVTKTCKGCHDGYRVKDD